MSSGMTILPLPGPCGDSLGLLCHLYVSRHQQSEERKQDIPPCTAQASSQHTELGGKLCPMRLSQAAASAEQMVFPGFEGTWFLSGTQQKYTEEDLARWVGSVAL